MKANIDPDVAFDPLQKAERLLEDAEHSGATELDLSGLGIGPALRPDWNGWETLGPEAGWTAWLFEQFEVSIAPQRQYRRNVSRRVAAPAQP